MLFDWLVMGAFTMAVLLIGGAGGVICYMLGAKRRLDMPHEATLVRKTETQDVNSETNFWAENQDDLREKHFDDILQNIEAYDGTENGQRTVTPF